MSTNRQHEQDALAQVMRADEEEARRAFWWRLLPKIDRERAMSLARLERRRAADELATFTIQERALLHAAISGHVSRMQLLMQCTGIQVERRPAVDQVGAVARLAQQEQEQEQEQGSKGQLH